MPQVARGKYDAETCLLWYVRYLQRALRCKSVPMPDGSFAGERQERLRLLRADADLRELELARERGEFAAVVDFERAITAMVVTTKARLLSLPSRLATQLVGQDRFEIESRLDKEIKEALTTLSRNGHGTNAPNVAHACGRPG
jgi:phage terminase Nu1 subunit (DNA packaging protein)